MIDSTQIATDNTDDAPELSVYTAASGPLVLTPKGKATGQARPGKLTGRGLRKAIGADGAPFPAKSGTFSVATVRAILAHYARIGAQQEPVQTAGAAMFAALMSGRLEVPSVARASRAGAEDPIARTANVVAAWEAEYSDAIDAALASDELDPDTDPDTDPDSIAAADGAPQADTDAPTDGAQA